MNSVLLFPMLPTPGLLVGVVLIILDLKSFAQANISLRFQVHMSLHHLTFNGQNWTCLSFCITQWESYKLCFENCKLLSFLENIKYGTLSDPRTFLGISQYLFLASCINYCISMKF